MYIERVPRHVRKALLPGLRVGALVKTKHADYSQGKDFSARPLPAGTTGKVWRIYDFGAAAGRGGHRFLCDVRFGGHPVTNFYTEELLRVRL